MALRATDVKSLVVVLDLGRIGGNIDPFGVRVVHVTSLRAERQPQHGKESEARDDTGPRGPIRHRLPSRLRRSTAPTSPTSVVPKRIAVLRHAIGVGVLALRSAWTMTDSAGLPATTIRRPLEPPPFRSAPSVERSSPLRSVTDVGRLGAVVAALAALGRSGSPFGGPGRFISGRISSANTAAPRIPTSSPVSAVPSVGHDGVGISAGCCAGRCWDRGRSNRRAAPPQDQAIPLPTQSYQYGYFDHFGR